MLTDLSFHVALDLEMTADVTPNRFTGLRVLHAGEGGPYVNPVGMPAVRPADKLSEYAPVAVPMTKEIQLMSYALNEGRITKDKWRALYGSRTMLTNNQSWPEQTCRDYVNGLDLFAVGLPKLMDGLICAGMFLPNARKVGEWVYCDPGVAAIDATKPLPTVEQIKANFWYFRCVTSGPHVYNILPEDGQIKLAPYVLSKTVRYPASWMVEWNETYPPDPAKFYNKV
jgi:hypothetical protein